MSENNLVKKYWPQFCRVENRMDSPPLAPLSVDDANEGSRDDIDSIELKIVADLYDRITRSESALDWWLRAELADVMGLEPCIVQWIMTKYSVNDEITKSALVRTWNRLHG